MGKVLAIVFLIVFVWWAYPFVSHGVWIAPTAIMPDSWMSNYATQHGGTLLATPPEGYGWFRFDFWHRESQYTPGRPVVRSDFHL